MCRLSADGLKIAYSLLAIAGLPLSIRGNAVYNLSDILAVLVVMCEKNTFVKSAIAMLKIDSHLYGGERIPSSRWFVNLFSRASPEKIE